MLTLIKEGGVANVFVLLFGFVTLGYAVALAIRPHRRKVGFVKWMCKATVYAVASGIAAAFGATLHYVAPAPIPREEVVATLFMGLGESMSPGILGFSLVALASMLTAIGVRRLDALET
jgi:hypothetical protein